MDRAIRPAEIWAVWKAIALQSARANQQWRAQRDEGLLDRLAEYHAPCWRQNVIEAARAICGDPHCSCDPLKLDADAYYYLQRFG